MSAYATSSDLVAYATLLDLPAPSGDATLLEAASRDVDRIMGRQNLPVAQLLPGAQGALQRAVCAQALFRHQQGGDEMLGTDDGLASVGVLSFSVRPTPRLAALVLEELDGFGLLARTSTVAPDPNPNPTP